MQGLSGSRGETVGIGQASVAERRGGGVGRTSPPQAAVEVD